MNRKFEQGFFANYKYWIRYYDTITKRSHITNDINQQWEYFTPNPNGLYKALYTDQRYTKEYGNGSESKNGVARISPIDVAIRDNFRNQSNLDPRIMYLDIETRVGTVVSGFPDPSKALEPVSLIQFLDSKSQIVYILGVKDFYYEDHYLKEPDHLGKRVEYFKCKDEIDLFNQFFKFLEELQPAVVYAWNGEGFDFPYLYHRCKRIGLDVTKFSPFWRTFGENTSERTGLVQIKELDFDGKYSMDLTVGGCYYIDIKRLYQKIVLSPRQSYSLNSIAEIELKSRKIEHTEFRTFEDFYQGNYEKPSNPNEYQRNTLCYKLTEQQASIEEIRKAGHGQFIYYGIIDVVLLQEIDKKVGLSALMTNVSNRMNSPYNAVLGTTKIWTNYIRNVLHDSKIIIDDKTIVERGADLEKSISGGFVRDPEVGKHEWIVSADVNSMYPKLSIAGSNMSPETFVFAWELKDTGAEGELKRFARDVLRVQDLQNEQNELNLLNWVRVPGNKEKLSGWLKEANLTMAPNGTFFRKDIIGVVPGLVKDIYAERKVVKKQMFVKEQRKIELEKILRGK